MKAVAVCLFLLESKAHAVIALRRRLASSRADDGEATQTECPMAEFYRELGCTEGPKVDNSTRCPDAFVCPDLHPDPNMCFYRGVAYKDRDPIPQSAVQNPCTRVCYCQVRGEPSIQCAAVDCFQTFDKDMQQCVPTYELDSCCSTSYVCGKDDIANLKSCEIDGQTYKEGQMFEPKGSRKTCICTEQWNGKTDDIPYCRDVDCGVELHYQTELLRSCAPVYVPNVSCPISFQCPSNTTQVVRGVNARSISAQCQFGNATLSVGDEISTLEPCTRCVCEVPPFVSCTTSTVCDKKQ